jgi:hypothetical protein
MEKPVEQGPVPEADVFRWANEELRLAEGKITFLGEQTRPILTVVFSTEETAFPVSLEHFVKFQQSPDAYGNDRLSTILRFAVTPDVFRRMIASVRPVLTAKGTSAGRPFLSLTLVRKVGDRFQGRVRKVGDRFQGREFLINRDSGTQFYQDLLGVFDAGAAPEPLLDQFKRVYPT